MGLSAWSSTHRSYSFSIVKLTVRVYFLSSLYLPVFSTFPIYELVVAENRQGSEAEDLHWTHEPFYVNLNTLSRFQELQFLVLSYYFYRATVKVILPR